MRIAFYAPLKAPTHATPSGDRRVGRLLMQALREAGHAVELVSDFRSYDGTGDAVRQGVLRDEGQAIAAKLVHDWESGDRHRRPDLWFTYHVYYKAPDWLGPVVSRALGIPYAIAEASYAPKRAHGLWALGHEATQQAIGAADLLLCPTGDDLQCVRMVVREDAQVLRLPPFLDPSIYQSAARDRERHRAALAAKHRLATDRPWLVVAAMMRPGDKLASYRMLAEVVAQLADLQWHLVVAGDGAARAEVQGLLEQAAPGRVRFLGLCDAEALAAVYAAGDLCVWPAVNEAYGMVMLEAQAAGLPVAACAVRGVPDVVQDGSTGLLAPPGDVHALAGRVRALLSEPGRRSAMAAAAAQFVGTQRSVAQAARLLNQALAASVHSAVHAIPASAP